MPMSSVTTANIGTPSTKAANIRWTSAAIQTAPRPPTPGKWPYAPLVSAPAWSRRRTSGIAAAPAEEEGRALREIDGQGAPHLEHELGRDLLDPALPRVALQPADDDGANERRDARE